MFGRNHCHSIHHGPHGRGPFGFHGHLHEHFRGGRSGSSRFFEQGDLRFVLLKLIAEQPSHGYELIKAVEQASGGAYSPSPGVIYPTLTFLEELGYVVAAEERGKKLYTITPEGEAFLETNRAHVEGLSARMADAAAASAAQSPQIARATENLKTALKLKLSKGNLSTEQIAALVKAMDDFAHAIAEI